MKDDKRLIRDMKREIKKAGNRKRRRYLKDVTADPNGFHFGYVQSDVLNEKSSRTRNRRGWTRDEIEIEEG